MSDRAATVVVHGLRDLLGTSLTHALRARGFNVSPTMPRLGDPGILVLDLDLPESIRVVGRAAARGWIVLGLARDDTPVAGAIVAGAAGWFPKSGSLAELADLLRNAAAGRETMHPAERERYRSMHQAVVLRRRSWVERLDRLSPREREVLELLDEGLRAAEITERLYVSIATVRSHIQGVLHKLEVGSQERAVAVYRATEGRRVRRVQ